MSRQSQILGELGLLPRWQSRHGNMTEPLVAPVTVLAIAHPEAAAQTAAPPHPVPELPVTLASRPEILPDWPSLQHQVAQCTSCSLGLTRSQAVFGKGNPRARIMLIGEVSGPEDDNTGLPFTGKAGQLLDNMLAAIGLAKDDVYIVNAVKCRPPGDRYPAVEEIASCKQYLQWQIEHVKPALLVALGRMAATTLLGGDAPIGSLRKDVHVYMGIPLFVTFHPNYLLRSPNEKAKAWQDLLAIRRALAGAA